MANHPDGMPCPHSGSSDTAIADYGPGPETFKTGNGDAAEPTSIVLTFRCGECGDGGWCDGRAAATCCF